VAGGVGLPMVLSEVKVWDTMTGREVLSLKGQQGLLAVTFSPDGRRLACLSRLERRDGGGARVVVYDARTGLPLLRLHSAGGVGQPCDVVFAPDGKRLFFVRQWLSQFGSEEFYEAWDATPRP
jgi:hypothetical protein